MIGIAQALMGVLLQGQRLKPAKAQELGSSIRSSPTAMI